MVDKLFDINGMNINFIADNQVPVQVEESDWESEDEVPLSTLQRQSQENILWASNISNITSIMSLCF